MIEMKINNIEYHNIKKSQEESQKHCLFLGGDNSIERCQHLLHLFSFFLFNQGMRGHEY